MAYNLYQVQMAAAWQKRCEKETAVAERFWMQQALKAQNDACSPSNTQPQSPTYNPRVDTDARSVVSRGETSVAPSGYTSKTSYLSERLQRLEAELATERESRKRVEADLETLKTKLTH